jgi:hypothetical protein
MFNYLKWELKDYIGNRYKWFIVALTIFFLVLITPSENLPGLFMFAYITTMTICLLGTYYAGTKHAVDTFSKKTFLLESMIPISAKKILLAKYILGIIINFIYLLLVILGLLTFIIKGFGIEETFKNLMKIVELTNPVELFRVALFLICSSIAFLSVVVLCFVIAKAINPSGKYDKILGFIFAFIALYLVSYLISMIIVENSELVNLYIIDLVFIIISTISFFSTSYLVERKLEIYN